MTDVFFVRPENPEAQRMKARLLGKPGLNLQMVDTHDAIAQLNPNAGSVFIYHMEVISEARAICNQIASLSSRLVPGTTVSIVIGNPLDSQARNVNAKRVFDGLPDVKFIPGDRRPHDIDLIILSTIKRLRSEINPTAPVLKLTYSQTPAPALARDQSPITTISAETSAKQPAQNANVFKPVTDRDQKKLLLSDAVDSQAAAVISNFGVKDEIQGVLVAVDEQKKIILCQSRAAAKVTTEFRSQSDKSKKLALSLSLQQSRVFFVSSNFRWLNDSVLEIALPSLVYFVQRRKDFRVLCGPEAQHLLMINDAAFTASHRLYDLSQGGISILVTESEATKLKMLSSAHSAQLQIEGDIVDVGRIEFRQQHELRNASDGTVLQKIGFSFVGMSDSVKRRLGSYVDYRGRAYVMDYMVESEKTAAETNKAR